MIFLTHVREISESRRVIKNFTLSEKGLNQQKSCVFLFLFFENSYLVDLWKSAHTHSHTHSGVHGPEEVEDGLSCKAPVSMVIDKDSYIPVFYRDATVWE